MPSCPPSEHQRLGRRALALWAALLWLAGFELLPNLHLGHHGELAPHSHGQAVLEHGHADAHEHAHEHGEAHGHGHGHEHLEPTDDHAPEHHEAEHTTPEDATDDAVVSHLDVEHGRHDLLHRGVAAMQPPLAMPAIADAAFAELVRVPAAIEHVRSRAPLQVRARGPPAAACRSMDCTA